LRDGNSFNFRSIFSETVGFIQNNYENLVIEIVIIQSVKITLDQFLTDLTLYQTLSFIVNMYFGTFWGVALTVNY
jgi:hypothetical protein